MYGTHIRTKKIDDIHNKVRWVNFAVTNYKPFYQYDGLYRTGLHITFVSASAVVYIAGRHFCRLSPAFLGLSNTLLKSPIRRRGLFF